MSRVFVITGAGVGLGRALARMFAEDGHQVALLGRTAAKVEAVAAELGDCALAVGCDVASPDSVNAAFTAIKARFGRVDVLINNAAIFEPFKIANARDEQIMGAICTNLAGPMLCVRAALPLMGRGGHVINVTSESVANNLPHLSVYQSSKAGLEQFSQRLYLELEPEGIRVSTVRAGMMFEEGKSWDVDMDAMVAFHEAATAQGIALGSAISRFTSVTPIFKMLVNLPPDLQAAHISLHARAVEE